MKSYLPSILRACFLTCLLNTLSAQDSQPMAQREIGLQLFDLERYNMIYKVQAPSGRYHRISLLIGTLNYTAPANASSRSSATVGLGYGSEKRSRLGEKLHFLHGPEASIFTVYQALEDADNTLSFSLSLSYVLGLMLDISDSFYISLELSPGLDGSLSFRGKDYQGAQASLGFSTSRPALGFIYRFSTPSRKK